MTRRQTRFDPAYSPRFAGSGNEASIFDPAYRPMFDGTERDSKSGRDLVRKYPRIDDSQIDERPFVRWRMADDPTSSGTIMIANRGTRGPTWNVYPTGQANYWENVLDPGSLSPVWGQAPFLADLNDIGGDFTSGGPITFFAVADAVAGFFIDIWVLGENWNGWELTCSVYWGGEYSVADGEGDAYFTLQHRVTGAGPGLSHSQGTQNSEIYRQFTAPDARMSIVFTIDPQCFWEDCGSWIGGGGTGGQPSTDTFGAPYKGYLFLNQTDSDEMSYGGCGYGNAEYPAPYSTIGMYHGYNTDVSNGLGCGFHRGRGSQAEADYWVNFDWANDLTPGDPP